MSNIGDQWRKNARVSMRNGSRLEDHLSRCEPESDGVRTEPRRILVSSRLGAVPGMSRRSQSGREMKFQSREEKWVVSQREAKSLDENASATHSFAALS